mgnify:FL=1
MDFNLFFTHRPIVRYIKYNSKNSVLFCDIKIVISFELFGYGPKDFHEKKGPEDEEAYKA